jgi:hypothetical protein
VTGILDAKKWRDFLTRGSRFFIAFGGVYRVSESLTTQIQSRLDAAIPGCPSGRAYERIGALPASTASPELLISGIGRLGNSIVQVLNGLSIARQLGSNTVYFHLFDAIGNASLNLTPTLRLQPVRMVRRTLSRPPRVIWRTYAMTPFGVLQNPNDKVFQLAREELRRGLIVLQSPSFAPHKDGVLTIYLRSGDIFAGPSEPDYGQPPWAFYEKVLQFKPWTRVELVTEDDGNPNQEPILRWCRERDIPVDVIGARLEDAVQAVVRSSHLISARGTFVPSLLFLTDDDKEVFQFQDDKNPLMTRKNLTVWRVTDSDGHYVAAVMSRNWANTDAQRALMLDYPADSLSEIVRMP